MNDFRLCMVVEVMMKSTLKELNMDEVCLFVVCTRQQAVQSLMLPQATLIPFR